jgi:hypothetical protein
MHSQQASRPAAGPIFIYGSHAWLPPVLSLSMAVMLGLLPKRDLSMAGREIVFISV